MTMIVRSHREDQYHGGRRIQSALSLVRDEVASKREAVIITKRGKPVAKLVPVGNEKDDIFGFLKGKGKILGDIVSPILTPEEWGDLY